ncbi:hypothetical protein [Brevibacillus gelatini]
MSIQNEQDLLALQRIGKVVAEAREAMLKAVRPGITTKELDRIGGDILAK